MKSHFYKISRLTSLLIFISITGCQSKPEEYEDLDKLFADFPKYLKASDDSLRVYCYKITPDESTVKFMEENDVNSSGIPEKLKAVYADIYVDLKEKYFERLLALKYELIANNQLNNLEYIDREEHGEKLMNKALNIYAVETSVILKSEDDTIFYTL